MAQLRSEVKIIATIRTMNSASRIEETPSQVVRIIRVMRAMKVDTMKTSPWAKFTMPMMPNTIV
jgi:hypothetical protein